MSQKKLGGILAAATITTLSFSVVAAAGSYPTKQSNAGDSISQGFDADDIPSDHPSYSWVQGTNSSIDSVYTRYQKLVPNFQQQPESVTGAEMIAGGDNFPAQASRMCAQSSLPQHVSVLLGANDLCDAASSSSSDPTANFPSVETYTAAFDAGMEELASCLPAGATIEVLSIPRIDQIYTAGKAKSWWCPVVWSVAGICRVVTGESNATRRAEIGAAVDNYNAALAADADAWNSNSNGLNSRGLKVVHDWQGSIAQGNKDTSVGTHLFSAGEINTVDCFHPNETGQAELACDAWVHDPDGSGNEASCFSGGN
jgi:lysophospholipase L1-like esterase